MLSKYEGGRFSPRNRKSHETLRKFIRKLNDPLGLESLVDLREVPIVAKVAAGEPIDEREEGHVAVDPDLIPITKDACALRVKGESMVAHHILDQDTLICRKTAEPRNRSVVVVDFLESGATVKFWHRSNGKMWLSPDPEAKSPDEAQGQIFEYSETRQGKVYEVTGLIRKMR
jgi:SOS-response transcriptional repressor LexA